MPNVIPATTCCGSFWRNVMVDVAGGRPFAHAIAALHITATQTNLVIARA
jgi:hypothetical protein